MQTALPAVLLIAALLAALLNGCALVTVPVKTAGVIVQTPFKMVSDDDDDAHHAEDIDESDMR